MRELPALLKMDANHHLNKLAYQHDIILRRVGEIDYQPDGSVLCDHIAPQAFLAARVVYVPIIRTALDYMVAMHEIGHIVRNREDTWEVVDEAMAWAWASMHALPEIVKRVTQAQWRWIGLAFTEYLKHAE